MLSTKKVVSAMIGLAMLALPATVLAGHHEDRGERARPYAQHDSGWHNGWFKHQEAAPVRNGRPIWQSPVYTPAHHWSRDEDENEDQDDYRPAYAWHHEPDADDYRPVPQWHQEPDGDDYWGSNYNYGEPPSYYDALPPTGYDASQQLSWLLQRRQAALRTLYLMRARHDSRAAGRIAQQLNNINARIRLLQGGRYGGYAPPVEYAAPVNPYAGNLFGNSYNPGYANPYYGNPGYANSYYGNNPTTNLLGSLIGPLLGSGPVR
jgi:hypothetical protein